MKPLVIDTNIALDLLVFADPGARAVVEGLARGELRWLATAQMREELSRVLLYPQVARYMARAQLDCEAVLARFDGQAHLVDAPAVAPVTCSDPDDQKFIDLAVAHQCMLLSKDRAVLHLRKRLAALGCTAAAAMPPPCVTPAKA